MYVFIVCYHLSGNEDTWHEKFRWPKFFSCSRIKVNFGADALIICNLAVISEIKNALR